MDFTVRFITSDGRDQLIPANGRVVTARAGSDLFSEIVEAKRKECPDFRAEGCRAVLSYHCYDHNGELYLYEDDCAYVMNSSGSTVSTV